MLILAAIVDELRELLPRNISVKPYPYDGGREYLIDWFGDEIGSMWIAGSMLLVRCVDAIRSFDLVDPSFGVWKIARFIKRNYNGVGDVGDLGMRGTW